MRCSYCHKPIPNNAERCPHCNASFPQETTPESFDAPIKWRKQDTYAMVGLGLSALSGGVLSPIALIFSLISLKGIQKHRWLSFWGVGISAFFIVAWIIVLIVLFALRK